MNLKPHLVLEHCVLSVTGMESNDFEFFVHKASIKVVVLATPALEQIRESIDEDERFGG